MGPSNLQHPPLPPKQSGLSYAKFAGRLVIHPAYVLRLTQNLFRTFTRPKPPFRFIVITMTTTKEADFGDTPVYFNSGGIANVLSLYRLGKKFKVTNDSSDCGGVFKVYTNKGLVEFSPTIKGLHAFDMQQNPEAAFLLVNDADLKPPITSHHQLHVKTVRTNYDGFSRKQIEGATAACCLMGMIATPSGRDF